MRGVRSVRVLAVGVMGVVVGEAGPAALVEALEGALEDAEHHFHVGVAAVDHGEGVAAEGGAHLAVHVADGARGADDDDRRGRGHAAQELEDAGAGLVGGGAEVEGEAQIDDGDVDGVGADELLGLAGGAGLEGRDAHGLEEGGHAVGPGVGSPAAPGEEEVEAVGRLRAAGLRGLGGRARRGGVAAGEMGAGIELGWEHGVVGRMARCVPDDLDGKGWSGAGCGRWGRAMGA